MKNKTLLGAYGLFIFLTACGCQKTSKDQPLIKDCPEEKIINKMPSISDDSSQNTPDAYYIYQGNRKEIEEFDAEWVKKNCQVKTTVVY